jgi:hypothetical protein
MSAINPEMRDLQAQMADPGNRMARVEGSIEQINRIATDSARQTIWQFVIFTATMAVILMTAINYQTEALRREFNPRFTAIDQRLDQVENRLDARFDDMNQRFDDMNKRLEDLNHVVISRRR